MPVSWWAVKATLNGTVILDDEMKLPSQVLTDKVLDYIAIQVYCMAPCLQAPVGAELHIIIQQIQKPWWWE